MISCIPKERPDPSTGEKTINTGLYCIREEELANPGEVAKTKRCYKFLDRNNDYVVVLDKGGIDMNHLQVLHYWDLDCKL